MTQARQSKITQAACTLSLLLLLGGCRQADRTPDAIRQNTAVATSTAARDAKAVAQGVFDGLRGKGGPVNINKASEKDLERLPGINSGTAQRIVDGRPYVKTVELRNRKILSKSQYDRISRRITAER